MTKALPTLVAMFLVASTPHAQAEPAVQVANFHQVDAGVYRSGRPDPAAVPELARAGIRTIISLETYVLEPGGAEAEEEAAAAAGIRFLHVPMNPLFTTRPSVEQIEEAVVDMIDPANQPVLVHCYHGSDRTGLVVGAYHIQVDHWTPEQAIADMRNYGHSEWYYWWDDILFQFD